MIELPQVTLVTVSGLGYKTQEHLEALKKSQEGIKFGAVKYIQDGSITDLDSYSRFMLFDLWRSISTDFALIVQADSWVINPDLWTNEFLNYSYIGAPWHPNTHFTKEGKEIRVGNGGFSLRSWELLSAFRIYRLEFTDGGKGFKNEDGNICNYHREELEGWGMKFAPVEVAARFSTELTVPETTKSFGFHKYLPK